MILCIDCGNSAIKFGVYENDKMLDSFSIDTDRRRSSFQYAAIFRSLMANNLEITGAILSSVVPNLIDVLSDMVYQLFSIRPLVLNKNLKTKLPLKIDNPSELGADLLAGSIGALNKYHFPLIVADLGTASKIYVVNKSGSFVGAIITAGMETSLKALIGSTSLLMEVPLRAPKSVVGKNTKESIQSGIVFGQAYMISEFARRIESELGYSVERILTGGFAKEVKQEIVCFHYEPNLVLDGLYAIYKMNEEEK